MRKSSKLYKEIGKLFNSMKEVETEYLNKPNNLNRKQIIFCIERCKILTEILEGIIG